MRSIISGGHGKEHGRAAYLDELVPAGAHNDRILRVGGESDARHPLGVAFVGDGVLAVTKSVPQLDGSVARAGDDLSVVGGERDGENVVGVADKTTGGVAGGELPQTQGLVPGGRQSVGAVGRDDLCRDNRERPFEGNASCLGGCPTYTVGDDVRMSVKASLGVAVGGLIASKIPDNQSLVTRRGEKHVRAAIGEYSAILQRRGRRFGRTYFSREVAREVTQPLWPTREPLKTNCSVMMES